MPRAPPSKNLLLPRLTRVAPGGFQFAELLNEPQSWVSRVETGETRMTVVELTVFCRALGISAADFTGQLEVALDEPPPQAPRSDR